MFYGKISSNLVTVLLVLNVVGGSRLELVYRSLILNNEPALHSGTNMKPHNIPLTPKLVKEAITNLHSSKLSSPDCILEKV